MTRLHVALISWILAFAISIGWTAYRNETKHDRRPAHQQEASAPEATPTVKEVIACSVQADAERLAAAFNKTNDLARALEDPKSEAAAISRRLLIDGRCAHFEHHMAFTPIAMPFDGSTFVPALAKPFNVVEANVELVKGSGHFFLVTEWRMQASAAPKDAAKAS